MFSHRSEYSSHRRQDADRSSGQWDDCNDRWDGRARYHSKYKWDSYHATREDGPSSTDRRSRTQEFSHSPDRRSSRDSLTRDSDRRSPVRRRGCSPVSDAPVKRRWTCAQDTDLRNRHKSFEDFQYTPPHVDDFQLRRTPPRVRPGRQRDEGSLRERDQDSGDRSFSDGFSDEDYPKPRRDSSWERTRSPDRFTKKYRNPRERMGGPPSSVHYEDYQNRSSRQPSEGDAAPQTSSAPVKKLSTGFQRFLDVLNRGVNVDALTKIVSQTSTEVRGEYISQSSVANAADRSQLPGCPGWRQKPEQHSSSGSTRSKLLTSPRPHRRSSSPNRAASDENFPQTSDGRRSLSSKSPSVENITLTPEDEEKRKQMQDVLQAIGVDLGFDELGQMTHRIQERLYGRKGDDRGQKVNQEQSTRLSSRRRTASSSSSSGSTFSRSSQDRYETKEPCRPLRCLAELKQSDEYNQKMSSSSSQDRRAAIKASAAKQTLTQPPPVPAPPPITSPPLPYHFPGPPPPFSPHPPPPFSPGPPPSPHPHFSPRPPLGLPPGPPPCFSPGLPQGLPPLFPPGPRPPLFAPCVRSRAFLPPMLPNPLLCNIFPPSQAQTRPLIPPPTRPFVWPPACVLNAPQNQNKKSAGYVMNRCLRLVETNQSNEVGVKK